MHLVCLVQRETTKTRASSEAQGQQKIPVSSVPLLLMLSFRAANLWKPQNVLFVKLM